MLSKLFINKFFPPAEGEHFKSLHKNTDNLRIVDSTKESFFLLRPMGERRLHLTAGCYFAYLFITILR